MVWTQKAVNTFLAKVTAGDAYVEFGYDGGKPKREDFNSHAEWSKKLRKLEGYFCYDKYRPGQKFWGKTPKAAAINAGFTIMG